MDAETGSRGEVKPPPWWRPFRRPAFAALWAANTLGLVGIAMSDMASGWLMTTLNADPAAVSRVQVAANLPMFLFTLLAGALTDIFELRRFLLWVEAGVVIVTVLFAAVVSLGAMTPARLLAITFVLSAAWTMAAPAWLALTPRVAPREDLDSATAINGASYNVSRAVGPALGGVAISWLGVAAPFWIFCAVNVLCVLVLLWWPGAKSASAPLPVEPLSSALRIGFRHVANNRHMVATMARTLAFFAFSSAYWALLPLLARERLNGGPAIYGVLLGAIGTGAIVGAFGLNPLKARFGPDRLVALGRLATAATMTLLAVARDANAGAALCFAAGAAWILVLATLYVSAQLALPDWVRGRGLAIFLTVIFGAMTFGGAVWGQVAQMFGLPAAHVIAAACMLVAIPATWRWKLQTGQAVDFTPSGHWRLRQIGRPVTDAEGPILVVVEYRVGAGGRGAFQQEIEELGRERKQDGAYAWRVFEDPADATRIWELFEIESWLECRLFCERVTKSDRNSEERLQSLLAGPPRVKFMIAPA